METLRIESSGPTTTLCLDRPRVHNALDEVLIAELTQAFASLPSTTRVVVLAGSGRSFCSGGDARWMMKSKDFTREENEEDAARLARMLQAVDECPCPTIARVQGAAMGGGAGLVAACDIAVAAEDALFAFPEVRLGLVPAVISTYVLPALGVRAARRYFLTGERFGAAQARALGLVHEVVPERDLDSKVASLGEALRAGGPRALSAAKEFLRKQPGLSAEAAVALSVRTIAELRVSPEGQEGLGAFLEKRKPGWS